MVFCYVVEWSSGTVRASYGRRSLPPRLPKSEVIGFASASLFFKTFQIHRSLDAEKGVLVYTVVSTKLINGSPFNSISVVPVGIR
jgi:CreA protein